MARTFEDMLDDSAFNAPVPGESLTKRPGALPFDRPPEDADPQDVLDRLFRILTKPQPAAQAIGLMESGMPLDMIVGMLVQSLYGEGKVGAPAMFLLIPPLTVILSRMAEAAGVEYKLSTDKGLSPDFLQSMSKLKSINPSSSKTEKAIKAAKKSAPELAEMPRNGGLMQRPESIL